MKKLILLIFLCTYSIQAQNSLCEKAYSKSSYALLHTQKALKANNFEHQMYYADRANEAFYEAQELLKGCGCKPANDAVFEGEQNTKNAMAPDKWETGRYYCKKALENARSLIDAISVCNEGGSSSDYGSSETSTEFSSISTNDVEGDQVISAETASIQQQQSSLEQKRQQLLEEQRKLEEQIRQQEQLKQKVVQNREVELQTQLQLKADSEAALQNLERALGNLFDTYKCTMTINISNNSSYMRDDEILHNETLPQTQLFYKNKTIDILNNAIKQYQNCN